MSKVFFDHLLPTTKLEKLIKEASETSDEKEEVWRLIDEIIHHRVLGCIFDHLPREHHKEFVVKLHKAPHDMGLWDYLKEKIEVDIEEFVKREIESVLWEILEDTKEKKNA